MKIKRFFQQFCFRFDPWGLGLFLAVMLPNFIWFAVPVPSDVLRGESVTPGWDGAASVFQVLMAALLCLFGNRKSGKLQWKSPRLLAALACCGLYYLVWVLYYREFREPWVFLALCLLPCGAFLFYEWDRKNWLALFPTACFTFCHLIYGVGNFLIQPESLIELL